MASQNQAAQPLQLSQAIAFSPTVSKSPSESKVLTPEVLGHDFVKLFVGNKRKEFTVHKKLLCDRAEFFNKAFNGSFQEAERGEMYLPEDDPDAVGLLVDFLYRGVVPNHSKKLPLFKLYILAEKLCMLEVMDQVIDAIKASHIGSNIGCNVDAISRIYSETNHKSKLRLFCVAEATLIMKRASKKVEKGRRYEPVFKTHPEFFLDLFRFQAQYDEELNGVGSYGQSSYDILEPCIFHCHSKEAGCHI